MIIRLGIMIISRFKSNTKAYLSGETSCVCLHPSLLKVLQSGLCFAVEQVKVVWSHPDGKKQFTAYEMMYFSTESFKNVTNINSTNLFLNVTNINSIARRSAGDSSSAPSCTPQVVPPLWNLSKIPVTNAKNLHFSGVVWFFSTKTRASWGQGQSLLSPSSLFENMVVADYEFKMRYIHLRCGIFV